jgi:hypothetical protein
MSFARGRCCVYAKRSISQEFGGGFMQTYASSHPIFREEKKLFKEPLANYSFLPLVVLYYTHAVVEAVGAIELLKHPGVP